MIQWLKRFFKVVIVVCVCIYLCVLIIVRAPATLVTTPLASAVPQLQLAVVSGSVWQGRSGDASMNIQGQGLSLGALSWQFQPLKLLALKACIDLKSEVFTGHYCRTLTGSNQLRQFQADLPARLANNFNRDIQFAGLTSVNVLRAEVTDEGFVKALTGNVSWRDARVNVQNTWFTLGDYAADVEAVGDGNGGITAALFDLAGPFGVTLDAVAGINTPVSAQGTILPKANAPEAIKDVLGLVAIPQDNGAFAVKYPL